MNTLLDASIVVASIHGCISRAGRTTRRRTDHSFVARERSNIRHVTLSSAAKRPCAPADLVDGEAVCA
jgi:hypothetical protein